MGGSHVCSPRGVPGAGGGRPSRGRLDGSLPTLQSLIFGSRRQGENHSRPCSEDEAKRGKATHPRSHSQQGGTHSIAWLLTMSHCPPMGVKQPSPGPGQSNCEAQKGEGMASLRA